MTKNEYDELNIAIDAVLAEYDLAVAKYRARLIGDEEYLVVRAKREAALAQYDIAFDARAKAIEKECIKCGLPTVDDAFYPATMCGNARVAVHQPV